MTELFLTLGFAAFAVSTLYYFSRQTAEADNRYPEIFISRDSK